MNVQQLQLRWRMAGRPVRVTVLSVAVIVVVLLGFLALTASSRINPTAASILVAVILGVATVFQQRQIQRRQHTVKLLTSFQSSERLAAADAWMAERIRLGRPVPTDIGADDDARVIMLLDFYEFVANLAQRGMVDIPLLLDLRGGAMTRGFHTCHDYILDRRVKVAPDLYRCLEVFAGVYLRRTGTAAPQRATPADATPATAERADAVSTPADGSG